jgi:hypothetical protein
MEIRKVLRRADGGKLVIIPKKSPIKIGDFVKIFRLPEEEREE